ncbi:unnamed protein product [Sphenostylis stenocarpa]|uniref:Uncharacterized protein n=1 Tax=Sphenostylis stenocarpa TaxID=92480 RepID=A0AA86VIS4_9FABA|nr:unnamed protein product [Sphenostylis stenocarpa]
MQIDVARLDVFFGCCVGGRKNKVKVMGSGDTCVAGSWGNNGSGHVRGASVEGGVGPGAESIGVRCTRHGAGMGNLCSVACYVMCALPPISATCPLFLGPLWFSSIEISFKP